MGRRAVPWEEASRTRNGPSELQRHRSVAGAESSRRKSRPPESMGGGVRHISGGATEPKLSAAAVVINVGPLSSVQELTNGQDERAHIGLHVASTSWPMTRCGSAGGGSSCRSHESMVPAATVSRTDRSYTIESEGKSALPGACVSGVEAQKR